MRSFVLIVALLFLVDCRHPQPAPSPTPIQWPPEQHCWWAAYRTSLSPDSVAARMSSAFTTLGLTRILRSRLGDTAWVQAGPTTFADSTHAGLYAARVVALRHDDTTRFRLFVAGSPGGGREIIPFCAEIMRIARTGALAPRGEESDDALPLWRRRP